MTVPGPITILGPVSPLGSNASEPMGGFELAKAYIATFLSVALPPTIVDVRTMLGIAPPTAQQNLLPTPDLILAYEPPALDAKTLATKYTMNATSLVYVSCTDLVGITEVNLGASGYPEYDATYGVNVLCWVKGQSWEDTIAARNNLLSAVRASLFRQPGLSTPDITRIEPNSWKEHGMTEPEVAEGNRHICGGYCAFNLLVRETLVLPPLGTTGTINVDEQMLDVTFSLPVGPTDTIQSVNPGR